MWNRQGLKPFVLGMLAGVGLAGLLAIVITGHRAIAQDTAAKGPAAEKSATETRSEKNKNAWRDLKRMLDRQDARRHRAHYGRHGGHLGVRGPHAAQRWHGRNAWMFHGRHGWPGADPYARGAYGAGFHGGPDWGHHRHHFGRPGWGPPRGPHWAFHHHQRGSGWDHHQGGYRGPRGPQFAGMPSRGGADAGRNLMRRLDQLEHKLDRLIRQVSAEKSEPATEAESAK